MDSCREDTVTEAAAAAAAAFVLIIMIFSSQNLAHSPKTKEIKLERIDFKMHSFTQT